MQPVRYGMVGGGQGAFIGAVHRLAARMDDQYELVAGALSSDRKRALASARASARSWSASAMGRMSGFWPAALAMAISFQV